MVRRTDLSETVGRAKVACGNRDPLAFPSPALSGAFMTFDPVAAAKRYLDAVNDLDFAVIEDF